MAKRAWRWLGSSPLFCIVSGISGEPFRCAEPARAAWHIGPTLIRRRIGLERLATNNQIAGFKFATVGVNYAVLLAFAVIVVWEKFTDAETAVVQEAGAAATLYPAGERPGARSGRDTGGLDQLPSAFDRSGMAADGGRKRKPRGDAGAQRALCRRPAPDG